jgi:hypothetical protein
MSRFILTSPSAPLFWFSLSSMVSGHHQMDHEVARGRYPEKSFPANGAAPLRGELFSGK